MNRLRLPGLLQVVAGLLGSLPLAVGACAPAETPADPDVTSAVHALRYGGRPSLAVEALSDRSAEAVPALVSLAADEGAPFESRWRALDVAGCLGEIDASSAARIAALLADADDGVASKATDELDRVQPFPRDAVEVQLAASAPHRAHRHAAWLLARHVDGDMASLLNALEREVSAPLADRDAECHSRLLSAITEASPEAGETLEALERGAFEPEARVREFAVLDLARCGEPGLRVLARLVNEGVDASQRHAAAKLLGEAGQQAAFAVARLVRCATEEASSRVRARAVGALGMIGVFDSGSVGAIREGISADDAEVRVAAATAAGRAPGDTLVEDLWRATRDADEDVAVAAAAALAERRVIAAGAFEPLLAAQSTRVRWYARRAWAGRVSRDALLAELASHRLGVGDDVVVAALARFPDGLPDSWSRVAGLAADADEETRRALVELAGQVGEPAVPVLAEIAAPGVSGESGAAVVRAAEALWEIGSPSAWEALASIDVETVSRDGTLRALVIPALARVAGDDRASRTRVAAALSDPSASVRFRVAIGIVRADRAWAAELAREGQLDLHALLDFDSRESELDRRDVIAFVREVGAGVPGVRGRLLLMARRRDLSEPEREACEAAAAALRRRR